MTDAVPEFLSTALPEVRSWPGRPGPDDLAALPTCPALYLLVDAHAAPVQLATTQSLKHVLISRLAGPQRRHPARADLAEITRGVRWRALATPFEGRWWYYRVARELYRREYRRLISFGPAYFLHIDWEQPVAELRVTERVWDLPGQFIGPWPTQKACQEALAGLWDLFDLCRYPEQVRKAPHGTRCAYAEMGRCDAPCDGTTPLAAYVERCREAWRFAGGEIDAWRAQAEERMRTAATERRYELAGQIKEQLRFARTWQAQWAPHVRPAEELHYLLGLPVTRRRAWKLFLFRVGDLEAGPVVSARRFVPETLAWLRAPRADAAGESQATVRMEQTWLLAHLLFSRAADNALVVRLPRAGVPDELEGALAQRYAALRQRGARKVVQAGRDAAAASDDGALPDAKSPEFSSNT